MATGLAEEEEFRTEADEIGTAMAGYNFLGGNGLPQNDYFFCDDATAAESKNTYPHPWPLLTSRRFSYGVNDFVDAFTPAVPLSAPTDHDLGLMESDDYYGDDDDDDDDANNDASIWKAKSRLYCDEEGVPAWLDTIGDALRQEEVEKRDEDTDDQQLVNTSVSLTQSSDVATPPPPPSPVPKLPVSRGPRGPYRKRKRQQSWESRSPMLYDSTTRFSQRQRDKKKKKRRETEEEEEEEEEEKRSKKPRKKRARLLLPIKQEEEEQQQQQPDALAVLLLLRKSNKRAPPLIVQTTVFGVTRFEDVDDNSGSVAHDESDMSSSVELRSEEAVISGSNMNLPDAHSIPQQPLLPLPLAPVPPPPGAMALRYPWLFSPSIPNTPSPSPPPPPPPLQQRQEEQPQWTFVSDEMVRQEEHNQAPQEMFTPMQVQQVLSKKRTHAWHPFQRQFHVISHKRKQPQPGNTALNKPWWERQLAVQHPRDTLPLMPMKPGHYQLGATGQIRFLRPWAEHDNRQLCKQFSFVGPLH